MGLLSNAAKFSTIVNSVHLDKFSSIVKLCWWCTVTFVDPASDTSSYELEQPALLHVTVPTHVVSPDGLNTQSAGQQADRDQPLSNFISTSNLTVEPTEVTVADSSRSPQLDAGEDQPATWAAAMPHSSSHVSLLSADKWTAARTPSKQPSPSVIWGRVAWTSLKVWRHSLTLAKWLMKLVFAWQTICHFPDVFVTFVCVCVTTDKILHNEHSYK